MNNRKTTKLVREGNYVAALEVEMVYSDDGWSPYLSKEDAFRLDDVRDALKRGEGGDANRAGVQPQTRCGVRVCRQGKALPDSGRAPRDRGT